MNVVERAEQRCQICVKALQNIHAAHFYITKLCQLFASGEQPLLSSLFLSTVIRYARPFSETRTRSGTVVFGVKPLKVIAGFDPKMHNHLIHVRDRLMAHDDLMEIPPRILAGCIELPDIGKSIPMEIRMSNKCLAFPADLASAAKIETHIAAALTRVQSEINGAVEDYRAKLLAYPKLAEMTMEFSDKLGTYKTGDDWRHFKPPSTKNHPHLNAQEPDFGQIHNGYRYEEVTLHRLFTGPDEFDLGDGTTLRVRPAQPGDRKLDMEVVPGGT